MDPKLVSYILYIGVALGLAVGLVFVLAIVLDLGGRIRRELVPLVFFAIVLAIMAAPIASERVLSGGLAFLEATRDEIGSSFWVSRIITLCVLLICGERILRFVVRGEWSAKLAGWPLLWAFVAYAVTNQIVNAGLGAHPSFNHKLLYAFILYFAVFLAAQRHAEQCFVWARNALVLLFVASALTALAKPNLVIEPGYSAGLLGIGFRYYGLATHANTIGPLAIALMICLWRFPFGNRFGNASVWALAALSLFFSQSKTSMAIACIVALYLLLYRYWTQKARAGGDSFTAAVTIVAVGCFCIVAVGLAVLVGSDALELLLRRWDSAGGGQLTTLTGRTRIWALAWREFLASPVFGYGPGIWDIAYRIAWGMPHATHAHNQLLQAVSSAGLVGLIGLLVYVVVLSLQAIRTTRASSGISVALLALMLLRSATEVPFASLGAIQSEFFVHLLLLAACVGFSPQRVEKQAAVSTSTPPPALLYVSKPAARHG